METVGVRELKENLSRYLRKVKSGERIIITDRKKEVAVIVPRGGEKEEDKIMRLIQRGVVHWTGGKPKGLSKRITLKGKAVSKIVLEDRR